MKHLIIAPDPVSVGDFVKERNTDCISTGAPSLNEISYRRRGQVRIRRFMNNPGLTTKQSNNAFPCIVPHSIKLLGMTAGQKKQHWSA